MSIFDLRKIVVSATAKFKLPDGDHREKRHKKMKAVFGDTKEGIDKWPACFS